MIWLVQFHQNFPLNAIFFSTSITKKINNLTLINLIILNHKSLYM